MTLQERFNINEIIEYKKDGLTWEESAKRVSRSENNKNVIEMAKKEHLRRLEEDYYIHSLS